ncbi:MAG: hypothetical protein WBX25_20945 [Rhodomicrobium sp.]
MSAALRKLAAGPHPQLALRAFTRYRGLVETGLISEDRARQSLIESCVSTIPFNELEATIARAFHAARKKPK